MITTDGFREALRRNAIILQRQSEGLSHEDSLRQPPFRGNCLNWVLGHLANNRDRMLELLGAPAALGAPGERYNRESEPITRDGPGVLPLSDLLAAIARSQEALDAALAQVTDEQMAAPTRMGERSASVGERLFFFYFHETYHVGQTELLRQLAGKNDKVI